MRSSGRREAATEMGRSGVVITVAVLALALVVLHSVADVLPDQPLFWLITPIRLVLAVGLLAMLVTVRRIDRPALWWRLPFDICALALVAAAAVPAHFYDGWPQWRGLVTCVAVGYLALVVIRRAPHVWPGLGLVSMVAVGTAALTGIRQTVNDIPTGFCRGSWDGTADACGNEGVFFRALGTFGNPNLLAGFLLLMTPLAFAFAASLPSRQSRAVGYLVASTGILGVAATGSRAALGALVVTGLAALVLRRPTTPVLITSVGAVLAGLAAGAYALVTGGLVGVRADVWRASIDIVRDFPFGVGMNRSGPFLVDRIPGDEPFAHAHNLWFDTMLEAGPVGLLAVVGLTVFAAVCVVRAARRGSPFGVAVGSGLAGFAVMCLVDDPSNAIRNAYAAWFVLGLAVGLGHEVRDDRAEDEPDRDDPPTGARPDPGAEADALDPPTAEGSAHDPATPGTPPMPPRPRRGPHAEHRVLRADV